MDISQKYSSTYLYSIALLFLAAAHYSQGNHGGYGLGLAINNTSWIAVVLVICVGVAQWEHTKKLRFAKTDIVLLLVVTGLFIPFVWSQSPWVQTSYGRYFAIVAFWMVIVTHRQFTFNRTEQILFWNIIVLGILIECVVGVFQFFWANELVFIDGHRPEGTFQQPNVYASFIATGLAISIYQLCSKGLGGYAKALHYLMIFFAGLVEVLIMSRVGMLGGLVVLVLVCFLFRQNKKQTLTITVIAILGVVSAVSLKNVSESSFRSADNLSSVNGRALIYDVSVKIIKEAPLLGHGLGSFHSVYIEKQAEVLALNSTIFLPNAQAQTHPHNDILFWWIEGGVIPVLSLISFALWFSVSVWRHGTLDHKVTWLCCIPIILHTQTEYPLYTSVPHLALLGLLVANASPGDARVYNVSFSMLPKMLYGVSALVCVFMLTNLHTMSLMSQYAKTYHPSLLGRVINPFAQQSLINYRQSSVFLRMRDPEFLPTAKELMEREIKVRPSEGAFWILYNLQQTMLISSKEQEKTMQRALYLFPKSVFFKNSLIIER
jgi:O-antigen polymerase